VGETLDSVDPDVSKQEIEKKYEGQVPVSEEIGDDT